ncbi:MAG TPA: hypothetical protein VNI02_00100 [Blastocatellia bacterium]|jgi:hypothetical protein|nr:hypothetical protein [Blastocatellia bacterium]
MAVTEIICGGVLLSALGAIGLAMSRPERTAEETPDTQATPDKKSAADVELESLRARNKVRLVEGKEVGFGIDQLPCGVYGFTCSPHTEIPLFEKKMFRSFEAHKLADGAIHIVGFVTEEEAAELAFADARINLKLYPDPYEKSSTAVSVPINRVARSSEPSRDKGNFIKLEVDPAGL